MQLENASVFLDFDSVVAAGSIEGRIAARYGVAPPRPPDSATSAREHLSDFLGHLARAGRPPAAELASVAAEVGIDPGFDPLVADLTANGAEVTILSDGLGFYVRPMISRSDVAVFANDVDFDRYEMRWPNLHFGCACSTCGTCKQAPIRDAGRRGRQTVFIGGRPADYKAALLADHVVARDQLADYCDAWGVPHTCAADLGQVRRVLMG